MRAVVPANSYSNHYESRAGIQFRPASVTLYPTAAAGADMALGIVGEFFALKEESGADVLAMQLGDFYEFFGEDARLVGKELDLKLSEKGSGGETYDMAGVPVDDLEPYLTALVVDRDAGHVVALAAGALLRELQVQLLADQAGVLAEELVEVTQLHRQHVRPAVGLEGEELADDTRCHVRIGGGRRVKRDGSGAELEREVWGPRVSTRLFTVPTASR